MALSPADQVALDGLKQELENTSAANFEDLSGAFVSKLLDDTPIYIAKSGFQAGSDGGTAGLRGRRLRIECKRYKETTPLSARSLAGEVMQASQDDAYLEAWVLLSTKAVSQTEREQALKAGETLGVATFVFDWTPPTSGFDLCVLAALCALYADDVERVVGATAGAFARSLQSLVGSTGTGLKADLAVWNVGYRSLREKAHARLGGIWHDRAVGLEALNQDAAGGSDPTHLCKRASPRLALDGWWSGAAKASVCVVNGREGVGKTWVTLDWANDNAGLLPIVVVASATAFDGDAQLTEAGLRTFLASVLRSWAELPKPADYWRTRVDRLLKRPVADGPCFLLIVDGLNQQPGMRWANMAQSVQGPGLAGRVRLLVTTRQTYFEQDLRKFGILASSYTPVLVEKYSGAELDALLKTYGMKLADLHQSLRDLAAVPRLFPLVQRLKDSAALQSEASVHRLLYEYGRDVLQRRQGSYVLQICTSPTSRRRVQGQGSFRLR